MNRLTVDDMARLAEDERYRYELVDGRLEKSPCPLRPHPLVQARLMFHLARTAPASFEFLGGAGNHHERRSHPSSAGRPGRLSRQGLEARYITRPPLLVVEVLSPDSVFRDMNTKRREYAEFGIPVYWVINPDRDAPGILELRLDGGRYREVTEVDGEDVFETDLPFPIRFVPHWLVADGDWRKRISGG